MGVEIERKFLVVNDDWRAAAWRSLRLRQGYLSNGGPASVRVRVGDDRAWLNVKSAVLGARRDEYEYEIPLADAQTMLATLTGRRAIDKTRHWVAHGGLEWEIDEFHGDNDGLVVAEIELTHEGQAIAKPAWLGAEVTDLARYYNVALIEHPYRDWAATERGR